MACTREGAGFGAVRYSIKVVEGVGSGLSDAEAAAARGEGARGAYAGWYMKASGCDTWTCDCGTCMTALPGALAM